MKIISILKILVLSIFLLILGNSVFAQDKDSLLQIKNELNEKKRLLQYEIFQLDSMLNTTILSINEQEFNESTSFKTIVTNDIGYLRDKPNFTGLDVKTLKLGDTIEVIDFINTYWKARFEDNFGFISQQWVKETDEMKVFKEYLEEIKKRNRLSEDDQKKPILKSGQFILIKGAFVASINSFGGVDMLIPMYYTNNSKTIKYIYFTVIPYNAVGDLVTCDISERSTFHGQVTGPIKAGDEFHNFYWSGAWYNNTIRCLRLTRIEIIYINGTRDIFINDLPKILDSSFSNNCIYVDNE